MDEPRIYTEILSQDNPHKSEALPLVITCSENLLQPINLVTAGREVHYLSTLNFFSACGMTSRSSTVPRHTQRETLIQRDCKTGQLSHARYVSTMLNLESDGVPHVCVAVCSYHVFPQHNHYKTVYSSPSRSRPSTFLGSSSTRNHYGSYDLHYVILNLMISFSGPLWDELRHPRKLDSSSIFVLVRKS